MTVYIVMNAFGQNVRVFDTYEGAERYAEGGTKVILQRQVERYYPPKPFDHPSEAYQEEWDGPVA